MSFVLSFQEGDRIRDKSTGIEYRVKEINHEEDNSMVETICLDGPRVHVSFPIRKYNSNRFKKVKE